MSFYRKPETVHNCQLPPLPFEWGEDWDCPDCGAKWISTECWRPKGGQNFQWSLLELGMEIENGEEDHV